MRIGITGVPGSGKTALAARLAGLMGLPLIKSQARQVGDILDIDPFVARSDPVKMVELQKAILVSQTAMEEECGSFITDTTTVDCLAHWEVYCRDAVDRLTDELYRKNCRESLGRYDALFYLPPPSCGADLELDRAIKKVLSEHNLPCKALSRSGMAEQAVSVLAWLKSLTREAAKKRSQEGVL